MPYDPIFPRGDVGEPRGRAPCFDVSLEPDQIGLELTLEDYMRELVAVFREVRRVLADDGNLWLNLGDSYEDKELLGVPWRVAFALQVDGRHKRDVWTIATRSFKGSHFAVMPEALAEPCVLAASEVGGLVLDCFAFSGTVGVVAKRHGRRIVGVELNPEYAAMANKRISLEPTRLFY